MIENKAALPHELTPMRYIYRVINVGTTQDEVTELRKSIVATLSKDKSDFLFVTCFELSNLAISVSRVAGSNTTQLRSAVN